MTITVLGLDPGSANFGYGVTTCRIRRRKFEVAVRTCGVLNNALTSVPEFPLQISDFVSELNHIVRLTKPTQIIAERFAVRNASVKGNVSELINIMLGVLGYHYMGKDFSITLPITWKNAVQRSSTIEEYLKDRPMLTKPKSDTPLHRLYASSLATPHEIDATLISLFRAQRYLGVTDLYCFDVSVWEAIMSTIPKVSTHEPTIRKSIKYEY